MVEKVLMEARYRKKMERNEERNQESNQKSNKKTNSVAPIFVAAKMKRKTALLAAQEVEKALEEIEAKRAAIREKHAAKEAEERQKASETQKGDAGLAMMVTGDDHQARQRAHQLINENLKKMKAKADQRGAQARGALKDIHGAKPAPGSTRSQPPTPVPSGKMGNPTVLTPSSSRHSTVTPATLRVLAPISASRINTSTTRLPPVRAVQVECHARIRSSYSTPRGVKRLATEVTDLTLDDD